MSDPESELAREDKEREGRFHEERESHRFYKPETSWDIPQQVDPLKTRVLTRTTTHGVLHRFVVDQKRPNDYLFERLAEQIDEKVTRLTIGIPSGIFEVSEDERDAGLVAGMKVQRRVATHLERKIIEDEGTLGITPEDQHIFKTYKDYQGHNASQLNDLRDSGHLTITDENLSRLIVLNQRYPQGQPKSCVVESIQEVEYRGVTLPVEIETWVVDGKEVANIERDGKRISLVSYSRNVTEVEAAENRELLSSVFNEDAEELVATGALVGKAFEQSLFAGDIKGYAGMFTRVGKAVFNARHFKTEFNLSPTYPGFAPLGDKIATAHEAAREMARGEAVVELEVEWENGRRTRETVALPNPHAMAGNHGLLKLGMQYLTTRVEIEHQVNESVADMSNSGIRELQKKDNQHAALAASVIFDMVDEDAFYAMADRSQRGLASWDEFTSEEMDEIASELGRNDKAKAIYPVYRKRKEIRGGASDTRGEISRLHERKSGNKLWVDNIPSLTSHLFDMASATVMGTRIFLDKDGNIINKDTYETEYKNRFYTTARDNISPEKVQSGVTMTIDNLALGRTDHRTGERFIVEDPSTGEKYSVHLNPRYAKETGEKNKFVTPDEFQGYEVWLYKVDGIGGKFWDNLQLVFNDQRGGKYAVYPDQIVNMSPASPVSIQNNHFVRNQAKVPEMFLGTPTAVGEVPVKLQEFYAINGIFNELFRSDLMKQLEEYQDVEYLQGLNKQIEVALGMMAGAVGMDPDTKILFEEYFRVCMLAAPYAELAGPELAKVHDHREGVPQERRTVVEKAITLETRNRVVEAGMVSGFITSDKTNTKWKAQEDKALFEWITEHRRIPSPFELNQVLNLKIFDTRHLSQIARLYPFTNYKEQPTDTSTQRDIRKNKSAILKKVKEHFDSEKITVQTILQQR